MHREYKKWWSPSLGREMELLKFGNHGIPVLSFPSSMGRFHEWEDFGMVDNIAYQINDGHNTLICVDSVDSESFYNKNIEPFVRLMRHKQYEDYIIHEIIPFIQKTTESSYLIVTGCSFGAYHSINIALRHPDKFNKVIAMGGMYDIKSFMDGFYDNNVYFNNPVDYIPNLNDETFLSRVRNLDIRLVTGEHDICWDANEKFSAMLNNKHIPNQLDVWRDQTGHDWPHWKKMILKHIV